MAVCAGGGSMTPEDRAESVLLTQPVDSILIALSRVDADPRLFAYCAENLAAQCGIADALAANSKCSSAIVAGVAPHLTAAGIHSLLDDLDRLTLDPRLLAALLLSTAATPDQRELL